MDNNMKSFPRKYRIVRILALYHHYFYQVSLISGRNVRDIKEPVHESMREKYWRELELNRDRFDRRILR